MTRLLTPFLYRFDYVTVCKLKKECLYLGGNVLLELIAALNVRL